MKIEILVLLCLAVVLTGCCMAPATTPAQSKQSDAKENEEIKARRAEFRMFREIHPGIN